LGFLVSACTIWQPWYASSILRDPRRGFLTCRAGSGDRDLDSVAGSFFSADPDRGDRVTTHARDGRVTLQDCDDRVTILESIL
jgi:hypothetical protein